MQATVESWDAQSGAIVCLDNGQRVTCPASAVLAGGWRLLRSGQRVRLQLTHDANETNETTDIIDATTDIAAVLPCSSV